jgi:prevent-host-death family protein
MDYLQFSKLSSSTKEYLEEVEKGKSYVILRKGKPIAKVIPFKDPAQGWKREIKPITLKSGADSTKILRQIRDGE